MKTVEQVFDFCMSLGGSCSSAIQLRRRGLRIASLPFDWLIHRNQGPLERQLELVKSQGRGWLSSPTLLLENELYHGDNLGRWQYRDSSGFDLLHDFHCDIAQQPKFLDDVKGVYARRYARLTKWIGEAQKVLLVVDLGYPLSNDQLQRLLNDWSAAFPKIQFTLFAILWSQPEDENFDSPNLIIRRLHRPKHRYDNEQTTPVWDVLDTVKLSGRISAGTQAPDSLNRKMPLFYQLLRIMFLGSRKLLRKGGWLASVE